MGDAAAARDAGQLSRGLVRLMMAVDDAYTQASREVGLTAQQAQLLCTAQRSAAVGDIAATLRCDRSNVTRLADRAASRGLVHRRGTERDGRVRVIELSDDGHQLVQRFIATLAARLEERLGDWPGQRRRAAVELLDALADALEGRPPARAQTYP